MTAFWLVVISALLAAVATKLLLHPGGPGDLAYERWAAHTLIGRPDGDSLNHVRVVAVQDDTDVAQLAARYNLTDVSIATPQVFPSIRRLHGRLMERLALSGCRVVVWDMTFKNETAYDDDFLRGVRHLKEAGIPVVVGVEMWWSGDMGLPVLSPPIAAETRRGCTAAWFFEDEPWAIPLMAKKATGDTLGCLALEGLVMAQHPFATPEYHFDLGHGIARIGLLHKDGGKSMGAGLLSIALSGAHVYDKTRKPSEKYGLREGDSSVEFEFSLPDESVLADATISYHEVFQASVDTLRQWFAGRVVVLGNLRSGIDRHDYPDGRSVSGAHGHAAAIQALMQANYIRFPALQEVLVGAFAGTCIGSALILWLRHRFRYRLIWAGMVVAGAIGVALAAKLAGWIVNPSSFFLGLTLLVLLCAGLRRVFGWPASSLPETNQ